MAQRLRKLDFSRMRKRSHSNTSSSSSPTVPVLESPAVFSVQSISSESPGKQKAYLDRVPVRPSVFVENIADDGMNVPAVHGPPSDSKPGPATADAEDEPVIRAKTRYFEEFFSLRSPLASSKNRINQESIIVVDVKIRTRVKDDEAFASLIASRMASIYQKPESQIMITIQQDIHIQLGTPRSAAYLITVFALPHFIAPVTNLRCTIILQGLLQELALIPSNRGVILFLPIHEENFATNGATMMGEVPRLDHRLSDEQDHGLFRSITRSLSRLKTGSTHSAAASEATTSSWTGPIEHSREKSSLGYDTSDEGTSRAVRQSRRRPQRFLPGQRASEPSHPAAEEV